MSDLWDTIPIDPVTQRPIVPKARRHADPLIDAHPTGNPCVRVFGPGPEGRRCKHCKHLFFYQMGGRYYKCALRPVTGGPGSDHRVNWPACVKFEPLDDAGEAQTSPITGHP